MNSPSVPQSGEEMPIPRLGELECVEVRAIWKHEARAFTPWLAQNLDRLAQAIGIRLELEQSEAPVDQFVADIVARDPQTDTRVLIENQLERADHTHLGQLLTALKSCDSQDRRQCPDMADWLHQQRGELRGKRGTGRRFGSSREVPLTVSLQ